MNAIKNNITLVVAAALAGIFLVMAFMQYQNEKEIKQLNTSMGEANQIIKTKNDQVKDIAEVNKELESTIAKVRAKEESLTERVTSVNSELFSVAREEAQKNERLRNIKSRINNIALKRPESLSRLINAKNKTLFKRITEATTIT